MRQHVHAQSPPTCARQRLQLALTPRNLDFLLFAFAMAVAMAACAAWPAGRAPGRCSALL